MRKLLATLAIAIALPGCVSTGTAQPVPGGTVASLQNDALALKLSWQAALTVAVPYIERPRCGRPTSPPLCSDQATVDVMRRVVISGDAAVSAVEDAAKSIDVNSPAFAALMTAAQDAIKSLTAVTPTK